MNTSPTAASGTSCPDMRRNKNIDRLIADIIATNRFRAGSLIITVFGDSVSQHGNVVWLGSLIESLSGFGLNPRQIRTAVFRLQKDGWLSSAQVGRRSYYSFTDFGLHLLANAALLSVIVGVVVGMEPSERST